MFPAFVILVGVLDSVVFIGYKLFSVMVIHFRGGIIVAAFFITVICLVCCCDCQCPDILRSNVKGFRDAPTVVACACNFQRRFCFSAGCCITAVFKCVTNTLPQDIDCSAIGMDNYRLRSRAALCVLYVSWYCDSYVSYAFFRGKVQPADRICCFYAAGIAF